MKGSSCRFALFAIAIIAFTMFTSATPLAAGTQQPKSANTPVPGVAHSNTVRLAVGGLAHTCSGSTDGTVMCWGLNGDGEVGDGTTTSRLYPVSVRGLAGATAIAAGEYHSCAVTNGGAKCWGLNSNGQLGNNSTTGSSLPVYVQTSSSDSTPLSGVTAIAAGTLHTCAVVSGAAKCWGRNYNGQLGDGTKTDSLSPVDVVGLSSGVVAISAGAAHTCALMSTGGVKCWGRNSEGQLGNRSNTESHTPVDVLTSSTDSSALSGATVIDLGDNHTCAVVNGGAKCWGYNLHGQLGNGATVQSLIPVDVIGLDSGAIAVDTGHAHSCAVMSTGDVKCWGYDVNGQLGDGRTASTSVPVNVVFPKFLFIPFILR